MSSKSILLIFLLIFTLIIMGYHGEIWEKDTPKDYHSSYENKKIAIINGEAIHLWEFKNEKKNWRNLYLRTNKDQGDSSPNHVIKLVLEKLIEKRLISQESQKLNVIVTDSEIEQAVKEYVDGYEATDLRKLLNRERLTMEDLRARIAYNQLVKKLSSMVIEKKINVSEKDILDYYKKNINEFNMPRRVRALQIVVSTQKEAEDTRQSILQGEDFSKIARSKSIGLEANQGGDLGFFEAGIMPLEFDRAIFKMKIGQISPVIKTVYGFHVFKVVDKKPSKTKDRKEAFSLIRKRILDEKRDKAFQRWKRALIERSDIKVVEGFI